MDLTQVWPEETWSDLLADLNLRSLAVITDSSDYIQQVVFDNLNKGRTTELIRDFSVEHELPAGSIWNEWSNDINYWHDIPIDDLNNLVKEHLDPEQLAYGDVIHLSEAGDYHNDGRYLWNGRTVVALDEDYIDYGTLPPSMPINNVGRTNYYLQTIGHNMVVYWLPAGYQVTNQEVDRRIAEMIDDITIYKLNMTKIDRSKPGLQQYQIITARLDFFKELDSVETLRMWYDFEGIADLLEMNPEQQGYNLLIDHDLLDYI